jgi:hypothetical protein
MRGLSTETSPYALTFESFGVQMQARASTEEILAQIESRIPPLARRIDESEAESAVRFAIVEEGAGHHSVWNPNNMVCTQVGRELALMTLEGQLRSWVALYAPGFTFVHAGVVERGGHAIVMPGQSFAGKTTLVAELVRHGATYFSDEFAVLDSEGLVHPYPKPLSIRSNDGVTLRETDTDVELLGGAAGDTAVPMSVAAVTYYVPGARWQPRRLSTGEGALALLSHTVSARERPQEALQLVTRAAQGAVLLDG